MEKLDKKQLGILGAAVVAAFAVGVAIPGVGNSSKSDLPNVKVDGPPASQVDQVHEHKISPMRAYRDQHPGTIDLLSPPVDPGAKVTTGVYAARGARIVEVAPLAGSWTIDSTAFRDDADQTWIEVSATNTGTEPARFVAIVQTTVP